jgi:hypothetical protein
VEDIKKNNTGLRINFFFLTELFFMYFCVLKYKMTLTMAYYVSLFTNANFHSVSICTVHTVYKYKIEQYSHNF